MKEQPVTENWVSKDFYEGGVMLLSPGKKDVLKQHHKFTVAAYRVTALQRRVLFMAIARMQIANRELSVKLPAIDIARVMDANHVGQMHKKIQESFIKNMSVVIKIKNEETGAWVEHVWVTSVAYDPADDTLWIKMNEELREYILGLKEYYTEIELEKFAQLSSAHAQRLYEIALWKKNMAGRGGNKPGCWYTTVWIEDLRQYLGLEKDEYEQNTKLRYNLVERAAKSINEAELGVKVDIEPLYNGRPIYAFKINCYSKELEAVQVAAAKKYASTRKRGGPLTGQQENQPRQQELSDNTDWVFQQAERYKKENPQRWLECKRIATAQRKKVGLVIDDDVTLLEVTNDLYRNAQAV